MVNPKISVIIPIYNCAKYLEQCLNSIISQSLKDIEIICVNDGSTDDSLLILEEYAKLDKRLIIINQKNKGAAEARNKGLVISKGQYLYFADSDDWFEQDMLEKLYEKAKNTDADIVLCSYKNFDDTTKTVTGSNRGLDLKLCIQEKVFSKINFPKDFFQITSPNAFTKLFKKSFIQSNRIKFQNLKSCNDVAFVYIALYKAQKISFIAEDFIFYRVNHANSITKSRNKYYKNIFLAAKEIKKQTKISKEFENSFYNKMLQCMAYEYSFCDFKQKRGFLQCVKKELSEEYFMKFKSKVHLKKTVLEKLKLLKEIYWND